MNTEKISFAAAGRTVTLYPAAFASQPLIIYHNYADDGSEVYTAMQRIGCNDCNLASIGNLDWNSDMTPWEAPALFRGEDPYAGGADEYLKILQEEILPEVLRRVDGTPSLIGLAGYSLAGLLALYAMYRIDSFQRVASMSGSVWYPGFAEYVKTHELRRLPERIYLSVGDLEDQARQSAFRSVRSNTELLRDHYRQQGIDVAYELNPGNHFKDAAMRSAKGIAAILV